MKTQRPATRDRHMVNNGVITRHQLSFGRAYIGTKRTSQIVGRNQRSMWGNPNHPAISKSPS